MVSVRLNSNDDTVRPVVSNPKTALKAKENDKRIYLI
jgi:hypothetical protein